MKYKKWDIWFARVKYEEGAGSKERPVVIVGQSQVLIFSLVVTSHAPRKNFAGEYQIKDWRSAGLSCESTVRISRRVALEDRDMLRKIGTLHPVDRSAIKKQVDSMYVKNT